LGLFRMVWLFGKDHRGVVLENLALRQGRPPISLQIRRLIRTLAEANPLWRAPRIHGELLKLGIAVSERTVSRVLQTVKRPPSQTWRTEPHRGDRCRRLLHRADDSLAGIVCLPRHRA
jgi:hypothetical protein